MNNRVIVKRDPPEHGFGLWPGYGKVAGKVLILDLGKGPTKILILLDSVPVWLRARASNRSLAAPVFLAGWMGFQIFPGPDTLFKSYPAFEKCRPLLPKNTSNAALLVLRDGRVNIQ